MIWSMVGAQASEQGDCSKFKGNIPHCCKKTPTVVDLLPGTPYNQHILNCCRGGLISSWAQDPATAVGRTTSSRSCNVHSICVPSEFIDMWKLTTKSTGVWRSQSQTSTTIWITCSGIWLFSVPTSTISLSFSALHSHNVRFRSCTLWAGH